MEFGDDIPLEEPAATWSQMRTRFHEIARTLKAGNSSEIQAVCHELYNIFNPGPPEDDPRNYPIIGILAYILDELLDLQAAIKYSIEKDGTHDSVLRNCESIPPLLALTIARLLSHQS